MYLMLTIGASIAVGLGLCVVLVLILKADSQRQHLKKELTQLKRYAAESEVAKSSNEDTIRQLRARTEEEKSELTQRLQEKERTWRARVEENEIMTERLARDKRMLEEQLKTARDKIEALIQGKSDANKNIVPTSYVQVLQQRMQDELKGAAEEKKEKPADG